MKMLNKINTVFISQLTSGIAMMLLMVSSAHAHHLMGGETPVTFTQGFISGLAHPVIGIDHLMYLVIAAVLSFTLTGVARYIVPLLFVSATLGGTVFHLGSGDIPYFETMVSLSLLVSGIIAFSTKKPAVLLLAGLFVVSGIFHGYAYGESIIGAETGPLLAYLIGFTVIQYMLIAGGIRLMELTTKRSEKMQSMISYMSSTFAILAGSVFVLLSFT